MRLTSIMAKNYRTLENIHLKFTKNYCTISGRNNAGKSCVIRLLSALFKVKPGYAWGAEDRSFDYKDDKTQWVKQSAPIDIEYMLELTQDEDTALISFVERIASTKVEQASVPLKISYRIAESDALMVGGAIADQAFDTQVAKDIEKRIRDSNLLFLYNSTTPHEDYYLVHGRRKMFYDFVMSEDERNELNEAGKRSDRRFRRLAKEHTQALSTMLGRLSEKYDVELSPPESYMPRRMPLGINLQDRSVDVALNQWGSGTQNRTHILMAILQANRIKTAASPEDKITPVVVIEEPESFLHPSAQAEFGRMLGLLCEELKIQIIVTTHSPYMLNQVEPTSNILLAREIKRKSAFATYVVKTDGKNWMAPFSEHLGLAPAEFSALKPVFSSYKSKALLVEGAIDQVYFECLKKGHCGCERIAQDVEIVPYGGKDTLKNTLLVQFVLRKFEKVFITYDRDAHEDLQAALSRLELKENEDYVGLGLSESSKECVEGLLPARVLAAVNGRETYLVMKLGSADSKERRKAKDALKHKYLAEFTSTNDLTREELKELAKVVKVVNKNLS